MEYLIIGMIAIAAILFYRANRPHNPTLNVGQPAPDFELTDQEGQTHQLTDFLGKWEVLYFYPKDDTPGCTKQACSFRDDADKLKALGAEVIGISVDTTHSHADFARKYQLPFKLLADNETKTAQKYNSLINLGVFKFARRNTFLINPQGVIEKIYVSVSAANNAADVITDLENHQLI